LYGVNRWSYGFEISSRNLWVGSQVRIDDALVTDFGTARGPDGLHGSAGNAAGSFPPRL
jgi:hypothetical protein